MVQPSGFVPTSADRRYLTGEDLSTGRSFRVGHTTLENRLDLLVELSRQRSVLHVGFADHAEVVAGKRSEGAWLHDLICAAASRCVGVDTSAEAVAGLVAGGLCDVRVADATDLPDDDPLLSETWDVILLGEVLEHVGNPVDFLSRLAARFRGRVGEFVVTVPNAWSLTTLRGVVRSQEIVNTDHRFWFTPYTLAKVLTEAGLEPVEVRLVEYRPSPARPSLRGRLHEQAVRRFDLVRSCCVARARPPG